MRFHQERTLRPVHGVDCFIKSTLFFLVFIGLIFLLSNFLKPYCGLELLFLMKTINIVHTEWYGGFQNYSSLHTKYWFMPKINTITKFLLFRMKYVIDGGCLFDY